MLLPIATTLVRRIFQAYVGIAIAVTAAQTWVLYREAQNAAQNELRTISKALEPSVTEALWNFQEPILRSLANGTLENEIVASVTFGDAANTIQVEASRSVGAQSAPKMSMAHHDLFTAYSGGILEPLGYIDLAVNRQVIAQRLYRSIFAMLIGAIVKAAGLWLIIVWAARHLLTEPLLHFTRGVENTDLVNNPEHPDYSTASCQEFAKLHEAYANLMERARENHKLQAEKLAAEARIAEQSRFLANASHDLRQPVHALSLYLGALSGSAMPAASGTIVEKARQCTQVVESMFHSILDLSQLDAGVVRPRIEPFPMQNILDDVYLQFSPLAREKGIELHVVRTSLSAFSDIHLLRRIAHNLVSNAIRYTQKGRVLVGCRRRGGFVRIEIHDTGPGIPDTVRQQIYSEYIQGLSSSKAMGDDGHGVGLGLAIAQRMSRLLGHPLALRSIAGRGTMFSLLVPIAAIPCTTLAPSTPSTLALESDHSFDLAGKIILVVDDELSILDATAVLIEKWGGIAVTTSSFEETLTLLETPGFCPDAMLCDYQLTNEPDGYSVITSVRNITGKEIPALLITGARLPKDALQVTAHVLYKPVAEEKLRAALSALFARNNHA